MNWVTGNEEFSEKNLQPLKVYPNPSTEQVYIETSAEIAELNVYSISGQLVGIPKIRLGSHLKIIFSEPGTYLIRYRFDKDYYMQKFIGY
jgi:hypothetical protein